MNGEKLKSKSDLLYERLREDIVDGTYLPGSQLPREAAFARQHQVALLTLRGALSRLEADGLIARLPRSGTFVMGPKQEKKRVIRLRIQNYHGDVKEEKYFNRALILGAANYAYLHQCELVISDCISDLGRLKLQYQQGEFLGIIWDRPQQEVYAEIEALAQLNVPQICINRDVPNTLQVSCDYPGAIRQAMRFLRNLGHRDIALLDLDLPGEIFRARQQEFIDQLRFMNVTEPESRLLRLPYPAAGSWLIIAERFRQLSDVTAVIVSYTHMEEFIRYADEAQLHIPRDLSVIMWGESDNYNLKNDSRFSVMTESRFDIGNQAVELLRRLCLNHDSAAVSSPCLVAGELIMRSSCGLPRDQRLVPLTAAPE